MILSGICAVLSAIVWLIFKRIPSEHVMTIMAGCFAASVWGKYQRNVIIGAFLLFVMATIFDPLLKPFLDRIFSVNTVGTMTVSFFFNFLLLFFFVIGFFIGKKILLTYVQ